ncbi:MAG TPA: ATP-binding cassette domain-containing protein [Candidatus Methanoperedenaceae archaeon]|nr:ATP-binding cassette domain-containing protein [Candidatus Methanoperedenaceae archaeon]
MPAILLDGWLFIAPVIVASNLVKRFGNLVAVDNISFTVEEGEIFGFLGPNGAGKTTAMKMIQCVSPGSGGKLTVFGMDVNTEQRKIKRLIGVVPQENNFDPDFTVYENLLVYSRYFDIPRRDAEKTISELLDFVQLDEKKDTMIEHLSGGMKRRLILARALVNRSRLLILDEPTVGLDPQARHLIWDRIRKLQAQGSTIVLTTHYLEEAARLCDRLVIMDSGKILVEGKPDELVRDYIGTEIVEVQNGPEAVACLDRIAAKYETIGDMIQVYTDDPQKVANALLEECRPGHVVARKATLEDVFLKLTGRKLRE